MDPDLFYCRALVRLDMGDLLGAREDMEQARWRFRLASLCKSAGGASGLLLGSAKNKAPSAVAAQSAKKNAQRLPYVSLALGYTENQLGNKPAALAEYTAAIFEKPDFVEAYVNRGIVRAEFKDANGSMEDFSRAMAFRRGDGSLYYYRALAQIEGENFKAALDDLSQAVNLNAKSASYYFNRALVRQKLGSKYGVNEDLAQAIKINPNCDSARLEKASLDTASGDLDSAKTQLTAVIEHPTNKGTNTMAFALLKRGQLYLKSGQADLARIDLQKSADLYGTLKEEKGKKEASDALSSIGSPAGQK
jgi:tetratricopeptide (TPR) repeat protein